MKIIIQEEWYTLKDVQNAPNKIYVFGDNFKRIGSGGQAQIRSAKNAVGLATKRSPAMSPESFFDDSIEDFTMMFTDIYKIYKLSNKEGWEDYILVFPKDGLGTGLSELPSRSPFIWRQLCLLLEQYFGIITQEDGSLTILPTLDEL